MTGHRRSIRLEHYDYSQNGAYFVTICAYGRKCIFGRVRDGQMILNDAGQMVDKWWKKLSDKYDNIEIDEYHVMPNHVHGIISIIGRTHGSARTETETAEPIQNRAGTRTARTATLGTMIQWFKTMSTNEYIRNVVQYNWPRFEQHIWQRNYYEHVIRSETDLNDIREYIRTNPMKWAEDEYFCL